MYSRSARYYDLIYSFKNYNEESSKIIQLINNINPRTRRILDVACGTAEHAKYLSQAFKIDGIDIEAEFIEIASKKIPSGRFMVADMCDFNLGIKYDVVLCLFSAIGYLTTSEKVVNALKCFKNHLNEGGVIVIEPWIQPDEWIDGIPHMQTVNLPELKICRMNTSKKEGTVSKLHFHYLIGKPEGVEHYTEDHSLALYTKDEMESFFNQAKLNIQYDPEGISGRGLYIAKPKCVTF